MISMGVPIITNAQKNDDFEITDARGETVKFDSPPDRIVSFMASNTEILFHLGIGDKVVGVDDYSNYPLEVNELPKVGDAFNVDYEKIVSLEPDVVVITTANTNMISSLNEYGLKVVVTNGNKIDDVYSDIRLLGKMCGIEEKADNMAEDIKTTMDTLTNDTRNLPKPERPKLFYIADTYQGIYTPGNNTFQNSLIERAGYNNIASDKENWATISEEEIIADDPEVIIAPNYLEDRVKELTKKDSWKSINAVKEDQIFFIDGDIMSRPGPRIVDAQLRLVNINKVVRSDAKYPDLKVSDIIISPSNTLTNGTSANVSATVENIGKLDAVNVKVSLWYSTKNSTNKTLINTTSLNIIEGKSATTTEKFQWKYPDIGDYTIIVEVDSNNQTQEINEDNNKLTTDAIVKESTENDDTTPGITTAVFITALVLIGIIKFKRK